MAVHANQITFIYPSNDSSVEDEETKFKMKTTQYLHLSQNATTITTSLHNQQEKFNELYFLVCTLLTTGCVANIIIITYFLSKYVGKQSRKATSIPLATSSDHTTIKIVTRRRKMSSYHFLLILLAIADLFCCVILLTINFLHMWRSTNWYCRLISLIEESCFMFPVCLLVLTFYERYQGIVYHRYKQLRKRTYLLMSVACFLLSWAVFIPKIFGVELQEDQGCVLRESYTKIEFFTLYSWYRFIDAVLPTALVFNFRWRISKHIHNVTNSLSGFDGTRRRTPSNINRKAGLRTINWLFFVYTLLIVPWRIVGTVMLYFKYFHKDFVQKHKNVFYFGKTIVILLLFMNNVVNIFVYLVLIPNFRRFVKKIFSCGILSK